ncbi:MAG: hypothetical protein ACE5M4_14990 [Anaerolineales bacterium]
MSDPKGKAKGRGGFLPPLTSAPMYIIALAAGIAILSTSSVMLFAYLPGANISEVIGFALILVGPVAAGTIIGALAKRAEWAAGIGLMAGLIGVAVGATILPVYLYVSIGLGLLMGAAAGFTAALGNLVMKEMRAYRKEQVW